MGISASNQEIESFIHQFPDLNNQEIAKKIGGSIVTETESGIELIGQTELTINQKRDMVINQVQSLNFKEDEKLNLIELLVTSYQDKTVTYLDMLQSLELDLKHYLDLRNSKIKEQINQSTFKILDLFTSSNQELNESIDHNNFELEKFVSQNQQELTEFKSKIEEKKSFFRSKLDQFTILG
jgi:hypothetical protein